MIINWVSTPEYPVLPIDMTYLLASAFWDDQRPTFTVMDVKYKPGNFYHKFYC